MLASSNSILALDVGQKRVGAALANAVARIARPFTTIDHTASILEDLQRLIEQEDVVVIVIGLPRGLSGQATEQTDYTKTFGDRVQKTLQLPVYWQDEAVTSQKAEAELQARGKPYIKGDIDALAATYILEDFLEEHPEIRA